MEYIISEEELRELGRVIYNIGYDRNSNREIKIEIDEFLESKQPIELVVEGWFVHLDRWFKNWHKKYKKDNPSTNKEFKIYIVKVKE